jgi:hypothetical protein
MEQASDTAKEKNTAAETAQLREARPKVCMIERIMGGYGELHKRRKQEKKKKDKKEAATEAKIDKAAT